MLCDILFVLIQIGRSKNVWLSIEVKEIRLENNKLNFKGAKFYERYGWRGAAENMGRAGRCEIEIDGVYQLCIDLN